MDPIFEAVLQDDKTLVELLKRSPELSRQRMTQDYLVEKVHWLYVKDTPLHLAAAALKTAAAMILLKNGAEVNAENRRGATPLHYACDPRPVSCGARSREQQAKLIELLVQNGAKPNQTDRSGVSPLHRAVRARSAAAVGQLLKSGAKADLAVAKKGTTPLHLAVQSTGAGGTAGAVDEQFEIIELLLRYGGDPGAKDSRGKTVFDWTTNDGVIAALRGRKKR